MKIKRIFAHRVDLPLHEGIYKWSGGKSVSVFDSTIIGVGTYWAGNVTNGSLFIVLTDPTPFRSTADMYLEMHKESE
jgi:hypothetical protein